MPKCSNCDAIQSKMNKGNLCKKCFHIKHNISGIVNIDGKGNDDDDNNIIDIDGDRTITDLIKEQMAREAQWHTDTYQLLTEQINYLKTEITHKNTVIENLIKTQYCIPSIENRDSSYYNNIEPTSSNNTNMINNESLANNDRIMISPDKSINNSVYENIEHDDINQENNSKWFRNTNNYSKRKTIPKHDGINFVHPNRFEVFTDVNYETTDTLDERDTRDENITSNHKDYTREPANTYRPHVITQDYPENNCLRLPIKPGINQYNQAVKNGKTTVIFSTSMTKGINVRNFNKDYKIGTARFRRFHSAKAKHVKHYVLPTLIEESPEVVLLQCGGNDLQTSKLNPTPIDDIAKHIIDTAKICENHGAQQILISSVITRKQAGYVETRRKELNDLLKGMCFDLGYIFINNDNIKHEHLYIDGVHLNFEGSIVLAENFLHALNNVF